MNAPHKLAYRVSEAASALGVSSRTVWRLIEKGDIKARQIGRCCVIDARALEAYLASLPTFDPLTKEYQS